MTLLQSIAALLLLLGSSSVFADGALLLPPTPPNPAKFTFPGLEPVIDTQLTVVTTPRAAQLTAPRSSVTTLPGAEIRSADPAQAFPPEELELLPADNISQAQAEDEPAYLDLWDRIRKGFGLKNIEGPLVERHEAWYQKRPEYMQRMTERSKRYLYHVVEELEKRDMPTEIALLPMIESAYNPTALSRMRAAGMWQFIPSTGKRYGLQQNFWYDGRRDVMAATRAALDYLQFLYGTFGDWQLALAAYNCGENGLMRAIAKNRAKHKPTNYASLNIPKETRNYLPKLQAVKNIISDPGVRGVALEPIPNQPYFTVVEAPGHMDIAKAAELADIEVEEFRWLNPGYTRPVLTTTANSQLLLPVDKAEIFAANVESHEAPLVSWQTHVLKKGETLRSVAGRFGTNENGLRQANGLTRHWRPRPGSMLLVPTTSSQAVTNLDETHAKLTYMAPAQEYEPQTTYRVKAGDNLYRIATRYKTTPARLKAINKLKSSQLRVGQRLLIDGPRTSKHFRHVSTGR